MKSLFVLMLLLVAACSSQPAPSPTAPAPTQNFEGMEGYEEQVGAFIVNVSGVSQRDFTGAAVYNDLGDEGIVLMLNTRDANAPGSAVQIALPGGLQPGTYDLVSYADAFDENGVVKAAGASYTEMIGGENGVVVIYSNVTAGSITLQTINPLSGSFTFTADSDGSAVTVNGILNQIPPMEQG